MTTSYSQDQPRDGWVACLADDPKIDGNLFAPIELLPPDQVSRHWVIEQEEYRKKGPRWSSPLYAKVIASDTERDTDFHHQATLILTERGFAGPAIARVLGISLRSVRSHLSTPSGTLSAERQEFAKRQAIEAHNMTKRGKAPFDVEVYLITNELVTEAEATWLGDEPFMTLPTREKVRRYRTDGILSQKRTAKLLGITRQAIGKLVQSLN
ncbi:MAG: hypothetical protein EOS63_04920 [Mesorhizobium sp.]|uniref:hypothetical protein n=1 Tax=Mesorhizobium sp. TaxID=1871066 RepID=UPI000FE4C731|nr:hypothetical protein [Mesorhizobium sp.]RWE83469.1 MAG: hypothetical protein EOS63_04920 [Mesorhizobium sp.]TIU44569.1 MAG: hypothetical protein E5W31_00370 [Mesorhizobium sp.]TJW61351.1 MAG: hypothetical protein E5V97_20860 [Mesorhizobium sp.]